ncbi:cysteine desulfurase [Bacteroidales bacterium OttesenSCG-928-K03]|nr:cysteine desulfurase [Odoribacter sp. OttesenSCG-928-L07]MDL2239418.1 cysteine desulfurase [Bacteroidales bacterium OttesenSCG-928-L14]MDL2240995.1 cysteine desulfurase [Bacteroidales bacterium OttesenSCG-928-K22]MDL2242946.1 cysteine desulfurase [Bacteroidales bacterium OttesenSCG-928-K03]
MKQIRNLFPILKREINGKTLVYFDNAATTQKPQSVIDELVNYYSNENSNIHRGVHTLSQHATEKYEETRIKVKQFMNAQHSEEIIFTRGTTESINLVASSFGEKFLDENDEIIISALEHHSNIVPWQLICEKKKAKLKVIPINEKGEIIIDELPKLISKKTKIIAVAHISNALGTINPIKEIIEIAHKNNIPVLIDGAQAISHFPVDVQDLDCDFYCFSGHKMYAPMGIGILYGKKELLEKMPPYQGGGEMIENVSFEKTTYNHLPFKFEAGTPNVGDALALSTAIKFIESIGYDNIIKHETELMDYCTSEMEKLGFIKFIGTAEHKAGAISFLIDGVHPYDTGIILDKMGIAIRTGHHCAEPVMNFFKIPGTARASFAIYNTKEEIDTLIKGLIAVQKMFNS